MTPQSSRIRYARPAARAAGAQRGVVLIIALIMIGVIAVSTAMAMRLSLFGDMVSQNLRAQNLALQAAEAGLRHCEAMIQNARATTVMLSTAAGSSATLPASEWSDPALWRSAGHEVPDSRLGTDVRYEQRPRCLIRHLTLAQFRGDAAPTPGHISVESRGVPAERLVFFRITSRGFSPDFRAGESGAEVWLQSMIRAIE